MAPNKSELETSVCIVGAGPAGIVLGNILLDHGIRCIVLDRYDRRGIFARARKKRGPRRGYAAAPPRAGLEAKNCHCCGLRFGGRAPLARRVGGKAPP